MQKNAKKKEKKGQKGSLFGTITTMTDNLHHE